MKGKVKCTCGWSWNKSDSSKKDMYICHECGRDNSNNMKNGGWLDDIPQAQRGKKKIKSPQYIDITKEYNIPQFTEQYINKAIELDKKYPGAKFVCDANGCADIASRAATAMGHDFGKANAWEYGNRSDIVFTNPSYVEELENPTGPLHNPTSYDVPKELLGMKNVLVGLNRKNNLLDAKGKKVRNIANAEEIAAAKNRQEANDSTDYANQDLYEGSRGYEHIGYMLDNNNLLHGTGANEDHPAFFVVDDINDGINLSGYGKYEPVEAIAEPTMFQSLGNKAKALGNKVKAALFEDVTVDKLKPPTKKKKNGGWLDNYNDSKASAPEGMVGDGYSNVGRNYSPAWGGQFQNGGPVKPSQKNYKTQGQYKAALREYELNLRKYELNNNPEKLKGESDKDYENRTKYFKYKVRQQQDKDPVTREYLKIKDDQNADFNPVTKTLRQIFTSPVHVGYGIYNAANPKDLDKYKSRATKSNEDIDLGSSILDVRSLLNPFDYGMKAASLLKQAATRTAKEVAEDQGVDLIKQGNEYINNYQMGGNVYPVNYVPQAQEGIKTYSYPLRDKLYPGEDEYFKANPNVGGMAAEDNQVIINPYSPLSDEEKNAIRTNETARLAMRNGYARPTFELTPEQQESFKNYSTDEQDQRETIIGRILSGDPSAKNVTPEQKKYAEELQKVLKFQMGGSVYPVNYVPNAQNGNKKKKKDVQDLLRDTEGSVNKSLGNPMQKAHTAAYQLAGKWYNPKTKQWEENDPVDNFRHPMAGRYASEAIQDKLYNIPVLSQIAGMVGSNALGVGHELSTLFHPKDKRGWYDKIRESGEDIFNNAVGATVGSLPISDKEKTNMLVKLSNKNMIPDGVSGKGGDMYMKHAMGGSIPGTPGFTYARTNDPAPSEGPYAKKTMASAQNGKEMKYYQEGLDWKPKTISKNGGWLDGYEKAQTGYTTGDKVTYDTPEYREAYNRGEVITDEGVRSPIALDEVVIQNNYRRPRGFWEQYADKIVEENKDAGLLGAIIGTPISAITSLPQLAMMKGLTGEMQRPSEAMDIENPYGAFAVDAVTDPTNLVGAGILTKEEVLAKLGDLRNVNAEGKIFSGMNNELNNMAIQNTERYMAKRTPSTSTLSPEMEPYVSRYTKLSDEPYIPYQEDEYIKWFNEQKAKMNPPVVKQDPRSILRRSSVIDINDVEPTKFNFIKQDLSEGNNIKYSFTNEQGNNIATFSGRKSPEGIYVNSIEVNPEFRRQGVASDIYKNIAKELQSKNEGTLFSRSGQHQFTDRDELGRSIAPANKLWENLVNKGEAEKFVEGMSHTYKINPLKQGGIIKDDRGQWAYPGEITEINSNDITMEGVPYDVLGISDTGDTKLMKPGKNYKFKGKKVTEFPMAKNGLRQEQKSLQNLDNLLNFTNYNKPQPGGWLNKYN